MTETKPAEGIVAASSACRLAAASASRSRRLRHTTPASSSTRCSSVGPARRVLLDQRREQAAVLLGVLPRQHRVPRQHAVAERVESRHAVAAGRAGQGSSSSASSGTPAMSAHARSRPGPRDRVLPAGAAPDRARRARPVAPSPPRRRAPACRPGDDGASYRRHRCLPSRRTSGAAARDMNTAPPRRCRPAPRGIRAGRLGAGPGWSRRGPAREATAATYAFR